MYRRGPAAAPHSAFRGNRPRHFARDTINLTFGRPTALVDHLPAKR
jgi:hypothetical protein